MKLIAVRKTYVIEFITFEELEVFVKNTTLFPHDPSYYNGARVIRDENSFIITNYNSISNTFTRNDVLITNNSGFVFPLSKELFLKAYHVININKNKI